MSQEKRKANVVEAPTMFIGVGGTGSKIVKKVYNHCLPEERENISFVCLDTNVNDLSELRGDAKDITLVQTSNTQTVGSYLDNDKDASKNWFPKNAVIYDKTVSEGAGQLRAISRLALNSTIKTGKINELFKAIDSLFKKNCKDMKQALRICVVSTASGGTGSGMILPFCMFVRDYVNNKYPNASVILRTMILLPETLDGVITSNIERDSQRRNAYATIKEFNAFMMKGSGFCDIEESLKRYKDLHIDVTDPGRKTLKSLSVLPCDFCFLLDGQDAEDATSNSFNQYQEQAALSLYEQNIGPMQKKAFSVEDNIIKELSNPGNYGRNRFGGIGAGRIIYPYEDVADYIAFDWIKKSIGGEKEKSKWRKYDFKVQEMKDEDERAGRAEIDCIPDQQKYINAMTSYYQSSERFTKDLINHYHLTEADGKVDSFFAEILRVVKAGVLDNKKLMSYKNTLRPVASGSKYEDPNDWSSAGSDYNSLVGYREAIRDIVPNSAKFLVEGILYNEESTYTIGEKGQFLESLLRTSDGDYCHPNAARYMLCKLFLKAKENAIATHSKLEKQLKRLDDYASEWEGDTVTYKYRDLKQEIKSLAELCEAADAFKEGALKNKKLKADFATRLNERMGAFAGADENYFKLCVEDIVYLQIQLYTEALLKQYKSFFDKFDKKVSSIDYKQFDLVERLKYKKGDSVRYVCASKDILGAISNSTGKIEQKGQLLDKELNAKIFDSVKKNVRIEKERLANADSLEMESLVDIFDEVLVDYFKKNVRRECKDINKDIVHAIAWEYQLQEVLRRRNKREEGEDVEEQKFSPKACEAYIKSVIKEGMQISAPGIQRMVGEEPREINAVAINTELKKMRDYSVDELFGDPVVSDTVPANELHYFNALYNLTPDKLKKFSSPKKSETGNRPGGLYHSAYTTYTRDIGPDCLKSSKMTTHIDRRWDSIAAMPELDLEYQHHQFLRTHKALVYGLVLKRIKKMEYLDDNSKVKNAARAFRYLNTNNHIEDMVVSNGTLCDEFYEILDSLYIDRALVEDIYSYEKKETAKDIMKRARYEETKFYKYIQDFEMPRKEARIRYSTKDGEMPQVPEETTEKRRSSLFEIPLAFYNSLPSYKHDEAELNSLVDAVIDVFKKQICKYESEKNAKFVLCAELKEQYDLLLDNYDKITEIKNGVEKNENKILEMIERKVQEVFESSPQPENFEDDVDNMHKNLMGC